MSSGYDNIHGSAVMTFPALLSYKVIGISNLNPEKLLGVFVGEQLAYPTGKKPNGFITS